jgi:hypothetical protein
MLRNLIGFERFSRLVHDPSCGLLAEFPAVSRMVGRQLACEMKVNANPGFPGFFSGSVL